MTQWGVPEALRMDNGIPWGTQSPLPSALGLWLVGLGIRLVYGRPRCSTDNAVVERSHGVLTNWVEPIQCRDFRHCQEQLAWAAHTQRERYPVDGKMSRLQSHPTLCSNQRHYDPACWSMMRVKHYLSEFVFRRKVEKYGQVTLFANTYSVGRAHARLRVELRLDAEAGEWKVTDEQGNLLRRLPAQELNETIIHQLQLAHRRKPNAASLS